MKSPWQSYLVEQCVRYGISLCIWMVDTPGLFTYSVQKVGAAAVEASIRQRSRVAQEKETALLRDAAVLEDIPPGDKISIWADTEDRLGRCEWQPLR